MSSQTQPPQPGESPESQFRPDDSFDDTLERLLREDGAQWRADTAPPIAPFARRVNAALREHWNGTANGMYASPRPGEEQAVDRSSVTLPPPEVSRPPARRRPGAWSTLIAVAAAVAVVAMLAGVLHTLSNARVATHTATPTIVPHVTHARGQWTNILQYTLDVNSSLYVSPVDPRIAYRDTSSPSDPAKVTLARTTDAGATWTTLTLPTDDGGWFGGIAFSPLDAQTVFLLLYANQNDPHCPAYTLPSGAGYTPPPVQQGRVSKLDLESPGSGGYSCTFQYVSHDGGAHWSHPSFPWPDQHLADLGGGTNGFPVQAQGTTLFAAVTGDLDGVAYDGVRLVASEDGGSTWTAVDNTIYAAGQVVTSYIAIPGTTSLYAMSVPQQTLYGQEGQAELWSSNDAGTHWTQVGLAPAGLAPAAQAKLTGTTRTPGGTTLYALDAGDSPVPVFTSRNGGRTWVQVSSAGWPSGQDAYPWSPTTLADGSLLLQFFEAPPIGDPEILASNANISFYGWRPGDTTWFPVTPRPGSRSLDEAWLTSPANGSQSIWIVVRSLSQGARSIAYTVLQCVLH